MAARGGHVRGMLEAGALPVERLLLETDSPYMMPDAAYHAPVFKAAKGKGKGKGRGRKMEPCGMPGVCRARSCLFEGTYATQTSEGPFSAVSKLIFAFTYLR